VARVRALLRRTQGSIRTPAVIRAGGLEVDTARHTASLDGKILHLTPSEFDLLAVLARHPGQTMTRQQLMDDLYGGAAPGVDRSIDSHIKNLRRKLDSASGSRFIETVYGVGYRLLEGEPG
jgi:DNA-binding response OmpR family regulator